MKKQLVLSEMKNKLGICRLNNASAIPEWAVKGSFYSITRTQDELSVVCNQEDIPESVDYEGEWRGLKVEGPLDFSLIGILASISSALAKKGISIFAISTYETDYILMKDDKYKPAVEALEAEGFVVKQ
ncbi:MAG TPA: ACT domain-containing protein [Clostridia bacterium]|nr:ACT domain-containing protein [Clostridia bacterium]